MMERVRASLLALCFVTSAVCLHAQQWLGALLYWYDRTWFYSWQASVKESTALLLLGLNQWRAPGVVQISSDDSVRSQIKRAPNGNVVFDFPDRLVMVANHQIYTDWISLWWTAYTAQRHGWLFIILKDSLKKIPVLGAGMMFFSWIFLSRNWEADSPRIRRHMKQLSNPTSRSPMWLLIFPEGTNMSHNTHNISNEWARKSGVAAYEHVLLPRFRGLQSCLEGLGDGVEWVYDCTIGYDGIPPGRLGEDIYNLRTLYFEGRKAPTTHVYWRRFAVKDIPSHDSKAFQLWLHERWAEKDELLKYFYHSGCFPACDTHIRAGIEIRSITEICQILPSILAMSMVCGIACYSYLLST